MVWTNRFSWLHHNKFFQTTPVFGFYLIYAAKNKYEASVWYTIIIICLSLTVKNIASLTVQYSSGETVTSMKIGRSQLALFPSMTFCVEMRLPEFNPEFMTGKKKNVSLSANVSSLQDEVDEALGKLTTREDFFKKDWDYIMFPLLFRYFTSMRLLEVDPGFLTPGATKTTSGIVLRTFLSHSPYFYRISRSIFSILNHSRALGVKDEELFSKLGDELASFSQFQARYQERSLISYETLNLKPQIKVLFYKLSELIVHGFCFDTETIERMKSGGKLSPNIISRLDFSIGTRVRDKIMKKNYGVIMEKYVKRRSYSGKYDEENLEKLDVILGDEYGVEGFLDYPALTAHISTTIRSHVTTTALYRSLVSCSSTQTKEQCIVQCKTDIIVKFCGCSPLLLMKAVAVTQRNSTTEMCKLENYFRCLKPSMVELYNDCIEKCASACSNVKYSLTSHKLRTYANYDKAKIYIHRKESEYPIFVESYAQSFESFFGELGGILGFYLGASILALFHLLIYIFKQFTHIGSTRNAKNEEAGGETEFMNDTITPEVKEKLSKEEDDLLLSTNFKQQMDKIENTLNTLTDKIEQISMKVDNMINRS